MHIHVMHMPMTRTYVLAGRVDGSLAHWPKSVIHVDAACLATALLVKQPSRMDGACSLLLNVFTDHAVR